jgi:hypothetical protein
MTISKQNNIISLNMRSTEFEMILEVLKTKDYMAHFVQIMDGYLDTYERDQ